MNLVIDQGNTRCKLALFEQAGEAIRETDLPVLDQAGLQAFLEGDKPDAAILSAVKHVDHTVIDAIKGRVGRFVHFTAATPQPLRLHYATPETLGLDRLAAAIGAWTLKPAHNLLIIDMGTAITYDLVTADGTYCGGNIAPGLRLRLEALHEKTGNLPMVQPTVPFEAFGTDTTSAIRAGVMQGIVYELQGYQHELKTAYPDLFAFLTGGDRFYFAESVKSDIFVCKNLVLTGLNAILNYHASI
ncbi:MAG: type III pantothenate kinase [Bacteroidales bacterium]|nr:type III pantothenate kinase [Bacteroidales bacterium]